MALQGKGFYIWKIKNCEEGNADRIARQARKADLSHVLIKVANGIYSYNYDWDKKIDLVPPVVRALQAKGIQVWGWHYVFGKQPISEARIAIQRVTELGLDGYVIDAESEYKASGKASAARQFMRELRGGLGTSTPIALSSYRYPSLHPLPWNEFLSKCDYNMPQVYWLKAHNPGDQLTRTLREFENPRIKYRPPIIPTGAAFREHGWEPSLDEIIEFLDTARDLKLKAANFWEWHNCREVLEPQHKIWKAIADYQWDHSPPPSVPGDISEQLIQALNCHEPSNVLALYQDRAVHITATRTVSGKAGIQAWYQALFNQIIPNAEFRLTGFSGIGSTRHFTWNAKSKSKQILDGKDTLGIQDDKITYHYSFFNVSQI
jgi:hypothetical protein